jgi:hypothetical protein
MIFVLYTDENYLFKDDDNHVFIETKNSVDIILIMNALVNGIFANQFILSIIKGCVICDLEIGDLVIGDLVIITLYRP